MKIASCKTCEYAKFERTATGRISRIYAGRCTFEPVIVASIVMTVNISTYHIMPDSGEGCAVYKLKTEG